MKSPVSVVGQFPVARAVAGAARRPTRSPAHRQAGVADRRRRRDHRRPGRAARPDPDGRISAGGATRLMPGRDGWCALTLSRARRCRRRARAAARRTPSATTLAGRAALGRRARTAADVTERARLLGLPAAALGETPAAPPRVDPLGGPTTPRGTVRTAGRRPVRRCGRARCAGSCWRGPAPPSSRSKARRARTAPAAGPPAFFDWMNGGKLSYTADFDEPAALRRPARRRRCRDRVLAPRGADPPRPRPARRRPHATAGCGCGSPATAPTASAPTGWRSATTPRCPAGWSATATTGRCSVGDAIADPLTGLDAAARGARVVAPRRRRADRDVDGRRRRHLRRDCRRTSRNAVCHRSRRPPRQPGARALGADNAAVERLIAERRLAPC